jgi:RNA polymerase sigma-70 factor, ECF subfamily
MSSTIVPAPDSTIALALVTHVADRVPRWIADPALDAVLRDEKALVAAMRRGDARAYETFVRTYGPRMLVKARGYVSSQEDAEDVLQSAIVLVLRHIDRFDGPNGFSSWLHRVVAHGASIRASGHVPHAGPRLAVLGFEDDSVGEPAGHAGSSAADERAREATHARLMRAGGRIPDLLRAATQLRYLDGLTHAESVLDLGRPNGLDGTSVQRGRIALRRMLAPLSPNERVASRPAPALLALEVPWDSSC